MSRLNKLEINKVDNARKFLKSQGIEKFIICSQKRGNEISFQIEGSPFFIRLNTYKEIL
jgi:hypothetical protein